MVTILQRPSTWLGDEEFAGVARPVEQEALLAAFESARVYFCQHATMAEKHGEALRLAQWAFEHGRSPLRWVQWALEINERLVRRWLEPANFGQVVGVDSGVSFQYLNRTNVQNELFVKRSLRAICKACPNCGKPTRASNPLCWDCAKIWPCRRDMPEWLLALVRSDERDYRRQVMEALFHAELAGEE